MVSRSIFYLFAIALLIAVVYAEEIPDSDKDAQRGIFSSAGKAALKTILAAAKKEWSKVEKGCLKKLFKDCPNPAVHPQRFYRCGKEYLTSHNYCYGKN